MKIAGLPLRLFSIVACLVFLPLLTAGAEPSGEDIVKQCYYKYAGDDQRSRLIIILSDENGKTARSEYLRLWKNYGGKNGVVDKVILFTELPTDNRGVNFMRWGYTAETGPRASSRADQWVYLPDMHIVRRVSQRDPKSLDWGFNDEDLRIRDLSEDTHRLKEITRINDEEFYVVESIPHNDATYGRWVAWYRKTPDLRDCVQHRAEYFDKQGALIKQETLEWEKIQDAWVWRTVVVFNPRTGVSANYIMQDIAINVGLSDDDFTDRQLRRGYPGR